MNTDDINYGIKGNNVNRLLMEVFSRTGCRREMENTECSSNSAHGGYITLEKESHVWGNGDTSSFRPGDHYQRHKVNETSPQIEEQSGHYRQVTVTTQRSLVNDTSRTEEESSLNIKITSAFSLNPKMSSSSFHGKELLLSSSHPQLTRIDFEPGRGNLSSRFSPPSVLQQQHAQTKSEVPKDHQLKASLTIQGNRNGPRCFVVNEDTNDSSLSNEKSNNNNNINRQQWYTKLRKSEEIESENRNERQNSVANKDDMQPSKNLSYTGLAYQFYFCNDNGGPSFSQQQDRKRKIQELTTKSNRLDQRETVSIYSSEELGNGYCKSDNSLRRCQQDNGGPKSLSFTTIKRTKRAKECDESIASDMITYGMPSLLSTASGEHHLPMVVSSHTTDNTQKIFKGSAQRHLVKYAVKVPLPCRLQKMSKDPFHEFTMTKEAQIQRSNVHPSISSGSAHPDKNPGEAPLPFNDKGRAEMKKPLNVKSLNSKRKVPDVQLLITPAPETFKNLEIRLGLENDEEPVVKIPNYFGLDFIPECRPNDPSTPKLVDVSQATCAENCQALISKEQPHFPCHKAKGKSVDNVVKEDMNAKQTRLENTRKKLTEETKVLRVFKPSKKSALTFLEKSSDFRHFAFSFYNDDQGPKFAPTAQAFAGASRAPVKGTSHLSNNSVLAKPDEYQETVSHVPLKMTADARSSNQACASFESISEFGSLLPQSKQANCRCAKSQVVVFNGINPQSPRWFSEGSNRKTTQERKNCTAFKRKVKAASTKDEYSLGSSQKHPTSNERETFIPKDVNILSELDSSKPTDTRTAERFLFHSSGQGLLNVTPDREIISTCTQTSSVVENATTAVSLGKRKHQCEVCGRAFSRSNTLITHNRIHTGDRPFPCDVCGRAFRQLGNLTRHKLTHDAVKPHACPICKKCFSRTSNLNTHIRTHTNYKPFVCEFCGKGFYQKVDMKIHRYTHTGEKPHKCSKCGRGFKQLTHLKYHMRTHSAVRLYKCEHCGKGFNQKGNLQAHIYGHTGNRPYRCDICGKGFTLTSTLNTHKRTHAPLKPFKCEFCEKAFYQKNALKTHYISSHPYTDGVCLL